jgi:tetratricopeptide (TPR) repeat protein
MASGRRHFSGFFNFLGASFLFIISALPYIFHLDGQWCYDDKVAVGGNPDVVLPNATIIGIFQHDFWGNDILRRRKGGWTHDSWRPLVTLTFRLNHIIGKLDTRVYHATNVLLHSLCCFIAYFVIYLFATRGGSKRPEFHALIGGLLFALNPIHSESVANITCRADTMSTIVCFCAALLYVKETKTNKVPRLDPTVFINVASLELKETMNSPSFQDKLEGKETNRINDADDDVEEEEDHQPCFSCFCFCSGLFLLFEWSLAMVMIILGVMCKETTLTLPFVLVLLDLGLSLPKTAERAQTLLYETGLKLKLQELTSTEKEENKKNEKISKDMLPSKSLITPWLMISSWMWAAFECLPLTKSFFTCLFGAALYHVRINVFSNGYSLQDFANEAHNPLANLKDTFQRLLAKAFVQSWAIASTALPIWLSHEHQASILVTSLLDYRNSLTLLMFGSGLYFLYWSISTLLIFPSISLSLLEKPMIDSVRKRDFTRQRINFFRAVRFLLYSSWLIVTYAPSSHAFLYVAFVVAERTLLLPSFGTACLLAEGFLLFLEEDEGKEKDVIVEGTSTPNKLEKVRNLSSSSTFCKTSPRGLLVILSLCMLSTYNFVRSYYRNLDWANEEALITSNIALYPTNNGLSIYGLGAMRLYQGRIDEAEPLLWRATNETTLAEPWVLLGQLYWKHKNDLSKAIQCLEKIERTSSPRKEMLQNLGLLLMVTGKAPNTNATARQRAEYLVLAGHKGHGYPMGHPNIGALASNAACVRLVSEPTRYGNANLAAELFEESFQYRHSSRPSTLKNAILFFAIQGHIEKAYELVGKAIQYIEELRSNPNLPEEGHKQADDFIKWYKLMELAVHTHAPYIASWAELPPVVGKEADDRLALIGGECTLELLYW